MKRLVCVLIILLLAIGLSGCKEDVAGGDSSQVVKKSSAEKKQSEDFRNYIEKKTDLKFMAEYTISLDTQGQTTTYKTAQYVGGKNTVRIDTDMMGRKSRAYLLPDGYYSCNDQQGDWQCMKFGDAEDVQGEDYTEQFEAVEENPDNYDITYQGTKSVAGTTAHCWGIDYAGQGMEYCLSKEGVPLYMEMDSSAMSYVMKATKYSTSVSSADFDLPAKAQDMDSMMEGMMEQYQGQMPEGYDMPSGYN